MSDESEKLLFQSLAMQNEEINQAHDLILKLDLLIEDCSDEKPLSRFCIFSAMMHLSTTFFIYIAESNTEKKIMRLIDEYCKKLKEQVRNEIKKQISENNPIH